ncbi:urease accessory protein [Tistlia consotensis]|uniref:Urease accessory protein UreE n=1 Tax=Tistlia consotensis USBA 355 TaxID=560819 RepID=A0A1Y6BBB6_9PROT|nr:urease accessory protein UreE [Tistlia consotensis]SMF02523.1 urease accessory protein [Tistlia consotensis USBA 355]SNR52891.1 urease accessory protein [Tistlia consotensis]
MTDPLPRLVEHAPAGHWPAGEALDSVTLDFDARHRRRIRLSGDRGTALLLDLPRAVALAEGDGLRLESGGWVAVRAAAEPVMEVRAGDPLTLARLAWHLGNRHLPTELAPEGAGAVLRLRPDPVIAGMLRGLGATVVETTAPFQPEGGAYAGPAGQGGGHHHHHDHDH